MVARAILVCAHRKPRKVSLAHKSSIKGITMERTTSNSAAATWPGVFTVQIVLGETYESEVATLVKAADGPMYERHFESKRFARRATSSSDASFRGGRFGCTFSVGDGAPPFSEYKKGRSSRNMMQVWS